MAPELYEDLHIPTDPEEQRRIHAEVLRRWLREVPEAADEAVQEGRRDGLQQGLQQGLQPLQHQFERRLSRRLTPGEQAVLRQRLATLGADRLGDVVLDLDAATLSAWLADPAAC
jgi:flagellar biosynthesis/type III secretory pathway protein FliH